jgi:hypothetical protein
VRAERTSLNLLVGKGLGKAPPEQPQKRSSGDDDSAGGQGGWARVRLSSEVLGPSNHQGCDSRLDWLATRRDAR